MKNIFLIISLLFFCNLSYGQSFSGGLNMGVTISQVDGDNYGGYHKIMPSGGVYVRNDFNDKWGITSGIIYRPKGSKEVQKNDNNYVVFFYKMNMDYVEVPFLLNYKLKKIGIPGLFSYTFNKDVILDFGLSYNYLIKGTEDFGDGPIPPPIRPFRKYEIAQHAGLTFQLSEHWKAGWLFSYTFIFLPIREHPGGQTFWFNRGQYNHNISFSLLYEF